MDIAVQGIGPVGGFGAGPGDLEALLRGTRVVSPEIARIERDGRIYELPCFRAEGSRITDFIPKKKLRRIDRFSRLALLGASLAISDAGVSPEELENTGIILATGYGASATTFSFLDSFLDKGDRLSMPTHFSNSVHNAAAAHISILLGIKGPSLTVSQFDLSVPSAFLTAVNWLREERVASVLVGGVDEYTSVLGYATAGFNSNHTPCSSIAGEGGCFFVLTREANGIKPAYATIAGADIFDPSRESMSSGNHPVIMGSRGYGGCTGSEIDRAGLSYGSLYGHFPAAAAIDIGTACLSLKKRVLFNPLRMPEAKNAIKGTGPEKIRCLKPGNDHLWGKITLETNAVAKG